MRYSISKIEGQLTSFKAKKIHNLDIKKIFRFFKFRSLEDKTVVKYKFCLYITLTLIRLHIWDSLINVFTLSKCTLLFVPSYAIQKDKHVKIAAL